MKKITFETFMGLYSEVLVLVPPYLHGTLHLPIPMSEEELCATFGFIPAADENCVWMKKGNLTIRGSRKSIQILHIKNPNECKKILKELWEKLNQFLEHKPNSFLKRLDKASEEAYWELFKK